MLVSYLICDKVDASFEATYYGMSLNLAHEPCFVEYQVGGCWFRACCSACTTYSEVNMAPGVPLYEVPHGPADMDQQHPAVPLVLFLCESST